MIAAMLATGVFDSREMYPASMSARAGMLEAARASFLIVIKTLDGMPGRSVGYLHDAERHRISMLGDKPPPQAVASRSRPTKIGRRFGTWALSLAVMVAAPLFPLLIESVKHNGPVQPESCLLAAVTLAVGYGFSSRGNGFRAVYLILFFGAVGLDFTPHPDAFFITELLMIMPAMRSLTASPDLLGWLANHAAFAMLLSVASIHAIERLLWHLFLGEPFPDWSEKRT